MSTVEAADQRRNRSKILSESLDRHVRGLRSAREAEARATTTADKRTTFLKVDELQQSFAVLLSMCRRFDLAAQADAAERRVSLDLLEVRASSGK